MLSRKTNGRPTSDISLSIGKRLLMALTFKYPVEDMEIWSATRNGLSFVISHESPTGPGFRGHSGGYVASWRRLYLGRGAIKIGGSTFKTFADAEEACNMMLKYLKSEDSYYDARLEI